MGYKFNPFAGGLDVVDSPNGDFDNVELNQGTAAAPSISFNGDPNTGIYSPGADQVAISTNGTGRLFVDSSGKVGLGTVTVDEKLQIEGAGTQALKLVNTTGGSYASPQLLQIKFEGQGTREKVRLETADFSANSVGSELRIYTRSASDVLTQALVVDQSQRVGIGTTSPSETISVAAPQSASVKGGSFYFSTAGNIGDQNAIVIGTAAASTRGIAIAAEKKNVDNAHDMIFKLSATAAEPIERARIDSSGRLGLGTSSPDTLLHITNTSPGSTTSGIKLKNQGSANTGISLDFDFFASSQSASRIIGLRENSADFSTALAFHTFPGAGGSSVERLRIDSQGRVGIGTTSPNTPLHVDGTSGSPTVRIGNTTGSTNLQITSNEDSDITLQFRDGGNERSLVFSGNTERMRIDSDGRLLVGTSSGNGLFNGGTQNPQFQIEGTTGNTILASLTANRNDAAGPTFYLAHSRGTAAGGTTVLQSGDQLGVLAFAGTDGTDYVNGATITANVDGTPGADDMPGRLVFSTTADGASSPTERMRIQANGNVLIGKTSSDFTANGCELSSTGGVFTRAAEALTVNRQGSDGIAVVLRRSNVTVGSISVTTSATAYNTSSDYRLKENVVPLTGAIDRVNQLQVHRFNFITEPGRTVDGFIAHEAQAVVPECVTGTKDEVDSDGNPVYQGIDQSKLVPLLTAALQEALQKIETLEQRLNDAGIA